LGIELGRVRLFEIVSDISELKANAVPECRRAGGEAGAEEQLLSFLLVLEGA
jgi:hypothetical protein